MTTVAEGDDDDEIFEDVESEDDEDAENDPPEKQPAATADAVEPEEVKSTSPEFRQERYNIAAREPLHARAERSALWELVALAAHNHPSVRKFSIALCADQSEISYPSDPLVDFTLMAFLDKFSYKKPKRKVTDSLHGKRAVRASESLVRSSEKFFDSVRNGEEADEDAFFGKFFRMNPVKLDSIEGKQSEAEVVDVAAQASGSESEEEAFEKAMHEEMRRLGGGMPVTGTGDVDEEDSDEVTAFAEAFKEEMESGGESGGNEETEQNNVFELKEIGEMEDMPGDPQMGGPRKKGLKRGAASVFAAADDYAEEIASADAKQAAIDEAAAYTRRKTKKTGENAIENKVTEGSCTPANGPPSSKKQKKRKRKKRDSATGVN